MKLSGAQVQALVWVAFKDGEKPTRRALEQIEGMELVTAPVPGRDPHWRLTKVGGDELRARGLTRDRVGSRRGATRKAVTA